MYRKQNLVELLILNSFISLFLVKCAITIPDHYSSTKVHLLMVVKQDQTPFK